MPLYLFPERRKICQKIRGGVYPIKRKREKYGALSNACFVIKDIYKNARRLFLFLVISALCGGIVPLVGVYLPKVLVDLTQRRAGSAEIFALLGTVTIALVLLSAVSGMSEADVNGTYYDLRMMYMRRLLSKSLSVPYETLDTKRGQEVYWKARDAVLDGDVAYLAQWLLLIAINLMNFTTYSVIIARLNPLLILLLTAMAFITYAFMKRGSVIWENAAAERSNVNKKMFILAENSCDIEMGKDIRLYSMKDVFLNKQKALAKREAQVYNKQRSGYIEEHFASLVLNLVRDAGAYAYLIYSAAQGRIEPGDFVLYFGAIAGFAGWINGITWRIDQIRRSNINICFLREFLEYEDESIENPQKPEGNVIEFKNVSFSYDGENKVLDNFNLRIEEGEHIALVGVNGAGKSTIVKLLCGFYRPDEGSVTVGGAEAASIEPEERFELISAVFQEVCILPHSLEENVSMKEEGQTDTERARESLLKAGLGKYADSLSRPLTRTVRDEGIDLSGGEAQKLMTARAVYKDAPILILDEPTAALDPIAESETYERFHSLSKGKSALYISHRLAGTRFCDRIVFMEDGQAKETGTHEELMKMRGGYARMFDVQSCYYKEGSGEI